MKFSEIHIGQKAEIQHKITEKDIEKFVDLTGDDNRLHVDKEYAKTTNFKKPVAHGMLGASFISTIIGTKLPGDGALWFSQNLEFLLPVRIGDKITVKAEVTNILKRQNIIVLRTDVFNQYKQKVIAGSSKVKIVEQELQKSIENPQVDAENTALIIGASGGIGSATALKLAEKGYNLALHYFSNKDAVTELKNKIQTNENKIEIFQADITNKADVQKLRTNFLRKFNTLSVIVNASTVKLANIEFQKLEWADIQNHFDINIKGLFFVVQEFLQEFIDNKSGNIITLSTLATESTPPQQWLHYTTAKYALNGFTKSLAVELAKYKIRVNAVSPGMTDTELISDIPEKAKLLTKAQTPLKRIAKPEDIANTISFLVSKEASFITGQTIRVNGGMNML